MEREPKAEKEGSSRVMALHEEAALLLHSSAAAPGHGLLDQRNAGWIQLTGFRKR